MSENVRKIRYADVGEVRFVRKLSGRNLKITLRPFRGVEVTVPLFVSDAAAGRFVEEKLSWIRAQLDKMARYEQRSTIFTEDTTFRTKDHSLVMVRHEKATIRAEIRDQVKSDAVNILNFEGQEGIHDFVGEKDKGIVLWRWFLLAALLFLLAEVMIIRWVKNG